MHIRKGNQVEILSGDDKGKRGEILSVDPEKKTVIVKGVNLVHKHVKPSRRSPQGGRLSKEMPVAMCKVSLVDPTTGKKTRTGVRYTAEGTKELYSKKSSSTIRTLSKPRTAYAKKS